MRKMLLCASLTVLIVLEASLISYRERNKDSISPEIIFSEDAVEVYKDNMSEEDLLQGVTAKDDRDGDVTSSIVVDSVYCYKEEEKVAVTYVVQDNSYNVTKVVHELIYR